MASAEPKSYDLNRFNVDHEMERLRTQALLGWRQESRILTMFGLQDGMSVLEPGNGPGFITEALLTLLPHSAITALDNEPAMLERSQRYLQGKADGRLRFVQASVMDTGLPENSFDFVLARFLFQHLPDPVGAAKEMLRVLKPGGKLALVDVDDDIWGIEDPMQHELDFLKERFIEAQAKRGGNRRVGRRFWRLLRDAGFEPLELEAIVYHSDELGWDVFRPIFEYNAEDSARQVEQGFITREEDEIIRASMEHFDAQPDKFVLVVLLAGCGQKPLAAAEEKSVSSLQS